jgi:hypothetical protein
VDVFKSDERSKIFVAKVCSLLFFGPLRYQALAAGPWLLRSEAEMRPHLHSPIFKPIRFLFAGLASIDFI